MFVELLYSSFLKDHIVPLHPFDESFEYHALQLGWQGSQAHFAVHLLTNPAEKTSKISYFHDYCCQNYEKYLCAQQTEDFIVQQMEIDILKMRYLVTYPFVWDDEKIDLIDIDLESIPQRKRTRKLRHHLKQNNLPNRLNSSLATQKKQPVLANYQPEHLVTPKEPQETGFFSAHKFVFLLDRAFTMFQDEELTVGWSRLKAQIEAYGQKIYEEDCDTLEEINDCAYCDLVTAFDWTYYAYYHRSVSDCEEEIPCAIIDALYAFFHTQTRSFPFRIAYFHFLFLVAAEYADGNTVSECIKKANTILSAHYESRIFDCAGYRTSIFENMNIRFAKREVLSAS